MGRGGEGEGEGCSCAKGRSETSPWALPFPMQEDRDTRGKERKRGEERLDEAWEHKCHLRTGRRARYAYAHVQTQHIPCRLVQVEAEVQLPIPA